MRIISGIHRGRRIQPPSKMPYTRPTTDIAREGLFNVLQHSLDIEALDCLDLFGGTGCISYELGSRGAASLSIVEKDSKMYDFIKTTAASLHLDQVKMYKMDVFKYIETCSEQFDFIFAGPPYALTIIDELPRQIVEKDLLKPGGWFVLEHTPRNDYKNFDFYDTERNYGTTIFSFFKKPEK